jgi:hypothetical protein
MCLTGNWIVSSYYYGDGPTTARFCGQTILTFAMADIRCTNVLQDSAGRPAQVKAEIRGFTVVLKATEILSPGVQMFKLAPSKWR